MYLISYASNIFKQNPENEASDSCPGTHPVRIPRLDFFIRFFNTERAKWEFADGTGVFHADYISGWDEAFLQSLLDGGDGDIDSQVTFRNGLVHQGADTPFRQALKDNRVPLTDTSCISTEAIDNVQTLPRGTCTGTLISPFGDCTSARPTTSNPTTANPTSAHPTTANPTTSIPTSNPTTAKPTLPPSPPPTPAPITANPTPNVSHSSRIFLFFCVPKFIFSHTSFDVVLSFEL